MFRPQLKLTRSAVQALADAYMAGLSKRELPLEEKVKSDYYNRKGGFAELTREQLLELAKWKTKPWLHGKQDGYFGSNGDNEDAFVREVTRIAFARSSSCRLRVGVLRLLAGVDWSMASVILHFCHENEYPTLDLNALYSVGYTAPGRPSVDGWQPLSQYTFDFWRDYTAFAREQCAKLKVDMRTLDRALWRRGSDLTAKR